jgi:hypothetical protein
VITSDESADDVWQHVQERLAESLPELLQLLDRDALRQLAESRELIGYASTVVKAWLLAEEGPSPELHDLLFVQRPPGTHESRVTKEIVAYPNRQRAAEAPA